MKASSCRFPSFFAAALSRVGLSPEEAAALLEVPVSRVVAWRDGEGWPPVDVWARLRARERNIASLSGNLLASWSSILEDLNARNVRLNALRVSPRGKTDAEMMTIAAFLLAAQPDMEIADDPGNGARGLIHVDIAGTPDLARPPSDPAPMPTSPPDRPTLFACYTWCPGHLDDVLNEEDAFLDMVFERGLGFFEGGMTGEQDQTRTLRFYAHSAGDIEALARFLKIMIGKMDHVSAARLDLHTDPPASPTVIRF